MINQNSEQYRGRQDYPSQTDSFCAEKKKKIPRVLLKNDNLSPHKMALMSKHTILRLLTQAVRRKSHLDMYIFKKVKSNLKHEIMS